eukprot:350255-Chlamydomonas_euryale.AAC.13
MPLSRALSTHRELCARNRGARPAPQMRTSAPEAAFLRPTRHRLGPGSATDGGNDDDAAQLFIHQRRVEERGAPPGPALAAGQCR